MEEWVKDIEDYTRRVLRNDAGKWGPVPDHLCDDAVQQVHVAWLEMVRSGKHTREDLLDPKSKEPAEALRNAVNAATKWARYQRDKRRREVELPPDGVAAPVEPPVESCVDLEAGLARGVGALTPDERVMLEMRLNGATLEEIGKAFGLRKQRVSEILRDVRPTDEQNG